MLIELCKNIEFLSKIKGFYKKYEKEILDVILFGSAVKGKYKPKDLDIIIVYSKKENLDANYELKKMLEKDFNPHIISKTYSNLLSTDFSARSSLLNEGYSLIKHEYLSKSFGYESKILFKYNLKNLNKSERMRFYYSLYGRGSLKGILAENKAEKFSETIILCAPEKDYKIEDFFNAWKIEYTKLPLLNP